MATAAPPTAAPAPLAVVHACASVLGEGPVYDGRTGRVLHVDIAGRKILSVAFTDDGPSDPRVEATTPEDVGCIALTPDPGIVLAAFSRTVAAVRLADGALSPPLATLPEAEGVADMRFNDGKVSPRGTLIVGRLHSKWRDGHAGAVYALDLPSRALVRVLGGDECAMPNGMAWIQRAGGDGYVFYVVDSAARVVTAHPTDPSTAAPVGGSGRVVVRTPDAVPDGMDADAAGRLWIALAETGSVAAYDPATGARVAAVSTLPTLTRVTSCAFGGPGLATLFVSSREERGERASRVAGALLAIDAGVAGGAGAGVVAAPAGFEWGV